jgi:hypothetical protein
MLLFNFICPPSHPTTLGWCWTGVTRPSVEALEQILAMNLRSLESHKALLGREKSQNSD